MLLPIALHALITICNVMKFLEDEVFIATDVKVKHMKWPNGAEEVQSRWLLFVFLSKYLLVWIIVTFFFMCFEDDNVEPAKVAKQWNIKIILIGKNKRRQDRAAALEVWDKLEEFSWSDHMLEVVDVGTLL
ncbi:hypothetical protein Ancab_030364 [Ancistrocladus abbreviatus]